MKYIGRILEKSEINFGKFGIQTEHLLTGNCDVTYEEMEFIMNANPSTQVLSIDLKQEITSSKHLVLIIVMRHWKWWECVHNYVLLF